MERVVGTGAGYGGVGRRDTGTFGVVGAKRAAPGQWRRNRPADAGDTRPYSATASLLEEVAFAPGRCWQRFFSGVRTFYPSFRLTHHCGGHSTCHSGASRELCREDICHVIAVDILLVIPAQAGSWRFCCRFRPYRMPDLPPKLARKWRIKRLRLCPYWDLSIRRRWFGR